MSLKQELVILFILLGVIFFRYLDKSNDFTNGQVVRISTRVTSEPIRYDEYQSLNLLGLKAYLPLFPEIGYGDYVVVEGEVKDKKLIRPKLISVSRSDKLIYGVRNRLISFFKAALTEPSASLVAGVTLGAKGDIPESFWEKLKTTGTAHVVVASGMNVTLVAGFLIATLTLVLKRNVAIPFVIFGIWLYSLLSGFDAPIVRAAIMGSIAFIAQETGRLNMAMRSLVVSALVMLLINPLWLVDLGFILSFVATLSLMIFQKPINSKLKALPGVFREGLSTSLAAQVGVAPILFVTFGQFSIWSPIINALILWTIPYITVLGIIGGLTGLLVPSIGKVILYITYPLTWIFINIVSLF